MDWLTDNPIANMYGPEFLVLYTLVIVMVLILCRRAARRGIPSPKERVQVDGVPDPREVAYLRGGENEVLRLVIFELIHRGFLRTVETEKPKCAPKIAKSEMPPAHTTLPRLEQDVFEYFSTPRTAREVFAAGFSARIREDCLPFRTQLVERGLLSPPEVVASSAKVIFFGSDVLWILGGYKVVVALSHGHTNVGFLIAMALFSPVLIFLVCRTRRLTPAGKEYLGRLRQTYESLRARTGELATNQTLVKSPRSPTSPGSNDPAIGDDNAMLLVVSLYGMGVLNGTPYSTVNTMFVQSASSSGCGGNSSSCGSGSSCGGGGGCGGGGCGGCGS